MRPKQTIIFVALFFIVVMLVALFLSRNQNKNAQTQKAAPPTPTPMLVNSPPRTLEFPTIPRGASFVYSGPEKTVPSSLPVYGLTETISPASLNSLATKVSSDFNIQSTPSATIDGQSFIYTRNDEYKTFSLSRTKGIVSVSYQRILVEDDTMLLSEDNPASGVSFFAPLVSLSQEMSLYAIPSGSIPTEGVVILERPLPVLKDHLFGILLNNIPLLTREYTSRWASMIVDNAGAVRVLNYILPPAVARSGATSIISPNDAIANLNAERGAILWITQTTGGQFGVIPSFQRGTLTDFGLVYIYQGNNLVPAYQFEGSGISSTGALQVFGALVLASPL